MKKRILFILALLTGITTMQARPVDVRTAQRLGTNFVQHKALFSKVVSPELELAYTYHAANGMATMYVFNLENGYVIVAADDSSSPILGYSDQGRFDFDNAPGGLRFMLDEISRGIATVVENARPVSSEIICRWKNLEEFGILQPDRGAPVVEPLIETKWDQGAPYNMYSPGNCPTGCVATAMAQLMKYWEWPVTGTGEHGYVSQGYGEQYANFGETTYDWENMIDNYSFGSPTTAQKVAVATLMYHCGVSVNMQFEHDGSGAFSADVPDAISHYFSYSEKATYLTKSASYDEWIALLKSNIDQHFPIYYSGHGTEGGHAFICDGYDVDGLFHFNFGWGGANNNYLLIDGENFEYSGSQAVVCDFIPNWAYEAMPKMAENLAVSIDSDVSLVGHLRWTNPTESENGHPLNSIDKVVVKRNGIVIREITDVVPGATMTYDDEVPFFDQYNYTIMVVNNGIYGRPTSVLGVFGPYCEWSVVMTSANFHGWDGGGITVQNAAGSYIDFLTTTTSTASIQRFQMALGNNNLYWTAPNSNISDMSFKVRDHDNQVVYQFSGPSSALEPGMLRTLNNGCGNENTCEAAYNLRAELAPDNDRTVILTWDSDHTPEFGYCIYRDGFLFNMSHELRYVDENTEVGGHCYYITALCNGGETEPSNEYCISSGTGCDPALDLRYRYVNNRVQLEWTAPENENVTGYILYRKTDETPYNRIKSFSPTITSYKDMSALQGTNYQYALVTYYRAIDCNSAYATSYYDHDKFHVYVDWSNSPSGLYAAFVEDSMFVDLRWEPAFQATSYNVLRDGQVIGTMEAETAFVDRNVTIGETYCYQIQANGNELETLSDELCFTIPVLPCPAPTNLVAGFTDRNLIRFEWQAPEDRVPNYYEVMVYDVLNDTTAYMENVYETSFEYSDFDGAVDFLFKVKAVYNGGESQYGTTAEGEDFVRVSNLAVDENLVSTVRLYPNPTKGQVTIEAKDMTDVGVYNLMGQCLMQTIAKNGQVILDMNSLSDGAYLIRVTTKNGTVMQKILKM